MFFLKKPSLVVIDHTSLTEKSARKDEKTLFWPPPISLVWFQINGKQNSAEITNNQTNDDIRIVIGPTASIKVAATCLCSVHSHD